MFGGRGFRGFVLIAIGKMEILATFPHLQDDIKVIRRYEGWYYTFSILLAYSILKLIGVASAHSLVPTFKAILSFAYHEYLMVVNIEMNHGRVY